MMWIPESKAMPLCPGHMQTLHQLLTSRVLCTQTGFTLSTSTSDMLAAEIMGTRHPHSQLTSKPL